MTYTNSSLVSYTKLSPNHSGQRTHSIDRITPHCVVGQCSVETLGNIFLPTSRQASCNYGIGVDGRVGMYVEEKNRSWCSSSSANDQRAVTIECASDTTEPYAFKDVVYQTLIKLCVDICKRNGKKKLLWLGDKDKTLSYEPKSDEMVLTVHRWFANKSCPGSWMYARMGDLAAKVTAQLGGGASEGTETEYPEKLTEGYYRVRKTWSDSKSQKGAYKLILKNPFIFIKRDLCDSMKKIVLMHEIGHDRLHRDKADDCGGFAEYDIFDMCDRSMEYEANLFAAQFLISDEELYDCINCGYDIDKTAAALCTDRNLVALKVDILKKQGVKLRSQLHNNKFLAGD